MLVVIPVCAKDYHLAVANLEHCLNQDGTVEFECVIAHESDFAPGILTDLCSRYFKTVYDFAYDPWRGLKDWPHPQNNVWQECARHVESVHKKPWFFWEQDAIPLKPGWLSSLWSAHQHGERPFSGAITSHAGYTYVTGVSIYPKDPSRYLVNAMLTSGQPWDIVAGLRDGMLRHTHDITPLIHHIPDRVNTHFSSQDELRSMVSDEAVLFHKCKDGSVLAVMNGKVPASELISLGSDSPMPTPSFTEQTPWESGYFTFPSHPSNTCYFNCSIIESLGKLWLFTRRCRYNRVQQMGGMMEGNRNDLAIWELRDNLSVKPTPLIPAVPMRFQNEQWEDPKAVVVEDRVHIAFANWVHYKPWFIRQTFTKLSLDWRKVELLAEPPFGGNSRRPDQATGHEKNWTWFWTPHGHGFPPSWHCVYTINPHVVFRIGPDSSVVQKWENHKIDLPWNYGEPRGGTMPIQVGDEYVCFFHSSMTWQKPKRRYYMGAYTFSNQPPYEILRFTPEPLMAGSEDDFRSLGGPLVIFPNGAVLRDGGWIVAFGVNDEACGWVKFPAADLEDLLIGVGRKRNTFVKIVDALLPPDSAKGQLVSAGGLR